MPPKRVQKEDSRANGGSTQAADKAAAEEAPREARTKRGAPSREYPEDANGVVIPLFEVESLDHEALHKYRKVHRLTLPRHLDSFAIPIGASGTATPTAVNVHGLNDYASPAIANQMPANATTPLIPPNRFTRVEKEEALVSAVKRHWTGQQIKENDAIVSFLYSVQNQDRSFKMRFNTVG